MSRENDDAEKHVHARDRKHITRNGYGSIASVRIGGARDLMTSEEIRKSPDLRRGSERGTQLQHTVWCAA